MSAPGRAPLVSIRGLRKEYTLRGVFTGEKQIVNALNGVDLTIARRTTLAVVGESGAGKSTLVRCLALIERPSAGEILFEGAELLSLPRKARIAARRRIQIIFQDPTSALNPGMTAAEIVAEPLAIEGAGNKETRRVRALELMEQVGLPASSQRKRPLEFSGGQRQRLAIARALALEPQLLILDESLSHLDLANQDLILRLLGELQQARGLTYIHVSHDLRAVRDLADEVAVLHEGKIVEQRATQELFVNPGHEYTRSLIGAMPSLDAICAARFA